jgi:hypothetical protein
MNLMFGHDGFHRRKIRDLMSLRVRIVATELRAARAAFARSVMFDMIALFGGNQRSSPLRVAFLPAPLTLRLRFRGLVRLLTGPSLEGSIEELPEFLPRRRSRSSIRLTSITKHTRAAGPLWSHASWGIQSGLVSDPSLIHED